MYYLLEANLRRYQITIPFPQRDLNLQTAQIQSVVETLNRGDRQENSDKIPSPAINQASSNLLANVLNYSAILQTPKNITTNEIDQLVEQMRSSDGLSIKDHRFLLTLYPKCFVGNEAVTWIVRTQKATREAAVRLGQLLIERGIIHHVIDEHAFKDEILFYRFYEDE